MYINKPVNIEMFGTYYILPCFILSTFSITKSLGQIQSYMRVYHAYKDICPRISEVLPLEREPNNSEDRFAVAHYYYYCIVTKVSLKNETFISEGIFST